MSDGLKLLGSIIDTGSVSTLRELDRSIFIDEEVELLDFLRSHYRRYGVIPAIATVEDELDLDIPIAEEVPEYYIKRVHDRKLYGVVKAKFNDLKDSLRRFDMDDARTVIDDLRASTRISHTATDIRNIREAVNGAMELYDYAHLNPGVSGVPSGWPEFDDVTGGYQPGDLVSFVARPAMGKTFLMLKQSLSSWVAGYSVLVVTMEMSIEQCARRIVAMQAGINPDYLRRGQLSTHALRRIGRFKDALAGTGRYRLFSGGMRSKVSDVDMLIAEYRPDIVYIDGVYLMQPDSKRSMSKLERIPEVFDELKRITLAQNLPVIVTTQFSRQAGKKGKEGSLENIAYTDSISTHSSLVVSINDAPAPHTVGKRLISFMKGREGESGSHLINYSFRPMDFTEVPFPRDANGNAVPLHSADQPRVATNTEWMADS